MNLRLKYLLALTGLLLLVPAALNAQDIPSVSGRATAEARKPLPAPMSALKVKRQKGFVYLCGGVGADEAERVKAMAEKRDMLLSFVAKDAGYLADVSVTIEDAAGKPVFRTFCDAPMLAIDFPKEGHYVVKAETGGYTLVKEIDVMKSVDEPLAVILLWPHQLAESLDSTRTSSSGLSGTAGTAAASSGEEDAAGEAAAAFDYRRQRFHGDIYSGPVRK
ncbi:MAG: hypothetical protein K0S28_1060 [Paucimonas sp.]|nr:hypothetical protein [Paucimonas sp.]